jgi:ATP-dependent DNA ligase
MKKITLYQKSKTNKIKVLEFWTIGAKFYTRWGQLDGKRQETVKTCIGMNIGKANETSPAQQAKTEMDAKIVIKKKEGYNTKLPLKTDTIVQTNIDLDNIPEAFCPNKPISKTPKTIIDSPNTYGQRKFDGHCLFLVKGETTEKVYSRRMEDRTSALLALPPIKEKMELLPKNTFVLNEFTFYSNITKKESPRHVAQVVRKDDPAEALSRYEELSKEGTFACIPFDALFIKGQFIGNKDYLERAELLKNIALPTPHIYHDWKIRLVEAEKNNWEGFVLRVPGEKSHISYTMDGEAHRAGSYKYKFIKTDDFIITACFKGKSGKHANFYAKFAVAQYDSKGNLIDRGFVGPGKLTHDELVQLTADLNSGKIQKNFVVEAEYQDIQDSGKLQFGIIQRLRPDKTAKECIAEDMDEVFKG